MLPRMTRSVTVARCGDGGDMVVQEEEVRGGGAVTGLTSQISGARAARVHQF